MKLLKDYDCTILYHPGKANVVANALSQKSIGSLAHIVVERRPLISEIREVFQPCVVTEMVDPSTLLAYFQVQPLLKNEITMAQQQDPDTVKLIMRV